MKRYFDLYDLPSEWIVTVIIIAVVAKQTNLFSDQMIW